jgi:uncharacterized membrane protein YhaH (DUF805 family)
MRTTALSAPGPLRGASPLVALGRFWTRALRFDGRASRSEFWWPMLVELIVVAAVVGAPVWSGHASRWGFHGDPFGAVPSPSVRFVLLSFGDAAHGAMTSYGYGSGADVTATPWDVVILVCLAVTAIPRWSLLVRRLHDRDHSGWWILLLVFTGPIGWVVVTFMVASGPLAGGGRFDRDGMAPVPPPRHAARV